jgi:ABC-2 type transport system permease protein
MRLVSVELLRLRSRRAVVVLLLGCALAATLIVAVSDADLRQAQQQVERDRQAPAFKRDLERCQNHPRRYGAPSAEKCDDTMGPQVDWYLYRSVLQVPDVLHGGGLGLVTVLMGLLMLVGTTFAGADWNSGSMSNQLLFEPRRSRVWLAKGAAVAALAAATSAVLLTLFWGAFWLLALSRDIVTPPAVWDTVLASSARAVPLVAAAALGAYAVTMLFRSTVFTLGAMFAVAVGATVVIALLGLSEAWLPNKSLGAVLWDGTRYHVEPPAVCMTSPRPPDGVSCRAVEHLSVWEGVRNLGVLLAVAVGASMLSFHRRDVP